jgi:hypothetical protein
MKKETPKIKKLSEMITTEESSIKTNFVPRKLTKNINEYKIFSSIIIIFLLLSTIIVSTLFFGGCFKKTKEYSLGGSDFIV